MEDIFVPIAIFYFMYKGIKELLDFFLKKKIINSGHFEKAEILGEPITFSDNTEIQKHPSLKWGLVAFFTGLGFIVSGFLYSLYDLQKFYHLRELLLPGVIICFTSFGFLLYFIIVMRKKK